MHLAYLLVVLISGLCNNRRLHLNKCSELKQRFLHVLHGIDQTVIDDAIDEWRVAWTSSRMCAGKRQTLRATIVTIFSHMTRDVSVFVKCVTSFCRTMLCISAAYAVMQCLSVCLCCVCHVCELCRNE